MPSLALAQTQTVQAGRPLTGTFTPSTDPTKGAATGYRCYLNDKLIQEVPASARTCALPAVTVGTHAAAVSAFNAVGESPKTTVDLLADNTPGAPSSFTVTVSTTATLNFQTRPDGSLAVNLTGVAAALAPATAGQSPTQP